MILADPSSRQRWKWRVVIFLCAVTVTAPLTIQGASCGQDFDFHLQSWLAVAQQWHHGVLYPHWIEAANYGAGEPRLVFYPPISWMLGALLGTILPSSSHPWNAAPIAFTLIVLTACGLSMNKLASRWLSPNAAALAGCAYILNPYTLFVAYERTAYGELAAGIWLPLIVLYTVRAARHQGIFVLGMAPGKPFLATGRNGDHHRNKAAPDPNEPVILGEAKELGLQPFEPVLPNAPGDIRDRLPGSARKKPRSSTIPLALAIAAIWLTNAPAAVMASYTAAAITLWIALRRRRWKSIFPVAAGYLLGIGLAAFYLIPAAYERRWVEIARAIDPGMRFSDSFLFEHTGQTYHDQVLRTASWIFVAMLVAIAAAGAVSWQRHHARRKSLLPLFAAAAVLLVLQLPASSFLWNHAPELPFLQFPWRWSLVLSIVFAMSHGLAVKPPTGNRLKKSFALQITLTLAAAISLAVLATHFFWQYCDDEDAISAQLTLFHSGSGFEGTDEYTARTADHDPDNSLIQQGLPQVRVLKQAAAQSAANADQPNPEYDPSHTADPEAELATSTTIETWQPETKSFTITARSPAYAVLRLMDYPAWQVRLNGTSVANRPSREDGLMTIPLQPGKNRIGITYAATPDVLTGRAVTAVSLIIVIALGVVSRRRRIVGYYD